MENICLHHEEVSLMRFAPIERKKTIVSQITQWLKTDYSSEALLKIFAVGFITVRELCKVFMKYGPVVPLGRTWSDFTLSSASISSGKVDFFSVSNQFEQYINSDETFYFEVDPFMGQVRFELERKIQESCSIHLM